MRAFNKLAKKLVAFEFVWHAAWLESVDAGKLDGLQATLLVRHPQDGNIYVNFDHEIWQLMREARCLDRMGGVTVPEAVQLVLLQVRACRRRCCRACVFLHGVSTDADASCFLLTLPAARCVLMWLLFAVARRTSSRRTSTSCPSSSASTSACTSALCPSRPAFWRRTSTRLTVVCGLGCRRSRGRR